MKYRANESKILCIKCKKLKAVLQFSVEDRKAGKPICFLCKKKLSLGVRLEKKYIAKNLKKTIRVCLKCDREFVSVNNNRICYSCKRLPSYLTEFSRGELF
jgi:hypothetical protein